MNKENGEIYINPNNEIGALTEKDLYEEIKNKLEGLFQQLLANNIIDNDEVDILKSYFRFYGNSNDYSSEKIRPIMTKIKKHIGNLDIKQDIKDILYMLDANKIDIDVPKSSNRGILNIRDYKNYFKDNENLIKEDLEYAVRSIGIRKFTDLFKRKSRNIWSLAREINFESKLLGEEISLYDYLMIYGIYKFPTEDGDFDTTKLIEHLKNMFKDS